MKLYGFCISDHRFPEVLPCVQNLLCVSSCLQKSVVPSNTVILGSPGKLRQKSQDGKMLPVLVNHIKKSYKEKLSLNKAWGSPWGRVNLLLK